MTTVMNHMGDVHPWVQQGFWEIVKQFFGVPKDDGESEFAFCKRIAQYPDETIAEFFMQVAIMAMKRMDQIRIWREQHSDVPPDLLEDTVELRILMEDDNTTDEEIYAKVIQLCNIHGHNYGDIVVQVQEAADRSF